MSVKNYSQLVIEPSGFAYMRTVSETPVSIDRAILQTVGGEAKVSALNIGTVMRNGANHRFSMQLSNSSYVLMYVELGYLIIRSSINSANGVVTMDPLPPRESIPVDLRWDVPSGMKLRYIVTGQRCSLARFQIDKCYLIASHADGRNFRLPLPNIFDDGSMCTGEFNKIHPTKQDALQAAIIQLDSSTWNSDLYSSKADSFKYSNRELFKWVANDGGFEQRPTNQDWTGLCIRCETEITLAMHEIVGCSS